MNTAAVKEAEEFYVQLDIAEAFLPSDAKEGIAQSLNHLIQEACDQLASAIDPATLTDIRDYEGERTVWTDNRLANTLVGYFLEKAHDDEIDPNLEWFDFAEEIPMQEVLNAPVETPQEFVAWLLPRHAQMFDGRACSVCAKPIPYADQQWSSDSRGRRWYHPACAEREYAAAK